MRQATTTALLVGALTLTGCGADISRAVSRTAADEAGSIRHAMLTVAEPSEAVSYFTAEMQRDPDDIAVRRGLARSLIRANRPAEGALAWRRVVEHEDTVPEDGVGLADALVRTSDWSGARAALAQVPPAHETFERYRLEAMIADSLRQWNKADVYYETARGLTTQPASVLNNWGYSKLTRGDGAGAETLLTEAITHDPQLFTAKNNLVLARATRRAYTLPAVPMTQEERAQLLHTAGLAAIKRGDVDVGRKLLEDAAATHPRHFEAAHRALAAL